MLKSYDRVLNVGCAGCTAVCLAGGQREVDSLNNKLKSSFSEDGKKIRNIWIVKPGEFSNRGNGIIVCKTLEDIKAIVKNQKKHDNGSWKTYIIQ